MVPEIRKGPYAIRLNRRGDKKGGNPSTASRRLPDYPVTPFTLRSFLPAGPEISKSGFRRWPPGLPRRTTSEKHSRVHSSTTVRHFNALGLAA